MNAPSVRDGDLIEVTVTRNLPFGVLVESSTGVPGLVRGVTAAIGEAVRVRVVNHDADRQRFQRARCSRRLGCPNTFGHPRFCRDPDFLAGLVQAGRTRVPMSHRAPACSSSAAVASPPMCRIRQFSNNPSKVA
jgi:hypothetical protein